MAIGFNVLPEYNPELYSVVFAMLSNPQAWLCGLLVGSIPLLLDLAIIGVKIELFPSYMDLLRERSYLSEIDKQKGETFRFARRMTRAQEKKHRKEVTSMKSQYVEADLRKGSDAMKQQQVERVINTLLRWRDLTGAILDATEEAGDIIGVDSGKPPEA
mmetsp:Transcript_17745/g.33649  ORF Transcript_17745/g.33649 Transcript_17745/m.33649 type:complete len:159 (-) Transcript_17745:119-595(-)|eukprot:CAMPEP_0170185052 /NCGR_PEP_ID=MMETSP0040_2-20121228/35442_1 /TAXON_ID=641309 /ORGANISM="Lotharella oceanica, Strain CCMP622" /LENGTH=158 /DNA_ID=CAMNT_0010431321 /DNA_START=49 /DNA_END=525 /DNA_ORIENTATION=-